MIAYRFLVFAAACSAALAGSFEVNRGQTDARVRFFSRDNRHVLFLMDSEAVIALNGRSFLRMRLSGQAAEISGTGALPERTSYLLGSDPRSWITNVPSYSGVRYRAVYPGVDLVFYEGGAGMEYDFEIAPGARSDDIRIELEQARSLEIQGDGSLLVRLRDSASMRMLRPVAYQEINGKRRNIRAAFRKAGTRIGFRLGAYDRTRPLVIDPVLSYSTYIGGSANDSAAAVALDPSGNTYVTGTTMSLDFPLAASFQSTERGSSDVFVAKLNPSGSGYVYSTYLGGSGADAGLGLAVDNGGYVCLTGSTTSSDFPLMNALQASLGGSQNAFVAKLNAAGSGLVYSTYLGGNGSDQGNGIAVDGSGNCYVAGSTSSTNFPLMSPLQSSLAGPANAFLTKISADGSAYVYSTYLGGSGSDTGRAVAVDAAGNAYLTGSTSSSNFPLQNPLQAALAGGFDVFVTKMNPAGSALVYSTYLGGAGNETGRGIAVDRAGNAYLTGDTNSAAFPIFSALQPQIAGGIDAFAAKLKADGSGLLYSTYLGGGGDDTGRSIAVDGAGNAYLAGDTNSTNFPVVVALQAALSGGRDAFLAELNASGSALQTSSYLGGSGDETAGGVAIDIGGNASVAGSTYSSNFPVAAAVQSALAGGQDAFVARILSPQNIVPAVNLSAPSLTFGNQFAGTAGSPAPVTLTNTGLAPLSIYGISTSGDFRQTNNCGGTVAAGASCTINVTFGATVGGLRSGAITVNDNAAGTPHIVSLTGNGVAPVPQVTLALSPVSAIPGGSAFTLRVNGSGFLPGAVVNWNGSPRPTTYVNTTQLNAAISASDIAAAGTAVITVSNPVQSGPALTSRSTFLTGNLRGVTVSQWPQPNLILYNRETPNQCDQIHSIRPDGAGDQCLTCGVSGFGGGVAFHNAKLSPDGNWILMQVTVAASNGCASVDGNPGSGNNQEVWIASYPNLAATQLRISPSCVPGACQNLIPVWSPQGTQIAFGTRQALCQNPGPPNCAMKLAIANLSFSGGSPAVTSTNIVDVNGATKGIVEPWNWKPDSSGLWFSGGDGAHPYPSLSVNAVQLSNNAVTVLTPWTGKNVWNEFPTYAPNGNGIIFSSSRTSMNECALPGCPAPLFALNELNFMTVAGARTTPLTGLNIPGSPDYAKGVPKAANGITLNPAGTQGVIDVEIPGAPKWMEMAVLVWPTPGVSSPVYFSIANPVTTVSLANADNAAGTGPGAMLTGDFNGDGKLDIVTANADANTVSVLLGNGDGTFSSHQDFPTGLHPVGLATGDFNGDGRMDLAVVNGSANTVSILLGKGDGGFAARVDYPVGRNPSAIGVGDFNLDGRADLAVANQTDGTVSVLPGNGDGSFQPASTFAAGSNPVALIVADFSGHSAQDLAVVNNLGNSSRVSFLQGNGNGTFRSPVAYSTGASPVSVAAGDLNGDGKLDLAVVNSGAATVSVLLGNGNGTFQSRVDYATAQTPSSVAIADFNLDGKLDLLVSTSGSISFLAGNGNGTFQARVDTSSAPFLQLVANDFNGDGLPDLAGSNATAGSVSVLLQKQARLAGLTLSPANINGGLGTTANAVTLSQTSPSNISVVLTSSNPAIAPVPPSITIPVGSTTANFSITTAAVTSATNITITASYNGISKTAALTVQPAALYALSISPSAIGGGSAARNCVVSIAGAAPAGGIAVTLASSNSSVASLPASVTIAAGQAISPAFSISTNGVSASTPVTISASYAGVTKTGVLTVNPASLYAVAVSPASMASQSVSTSNLVVLNGVVPPGGAVVQLSSSNPSVASVPASITIPAGAYRQTFSITAGAVATTTVVTISATWSGVTVSTNLTVTSP